MPRANRHYVRHLIWHITHRCHQKEFLLKFSKDRRRWLRWLFEAKKRYGLCVLNYSVTCNHIHLIVLDRGGNRIAHSMQLAAGRTAQEYNQRKGRRGAFWEDRYHATAVDTDEHLARCLVYIDLNMVRAGVVTHPAQWRECGYREIQVPPQRYAIVDVEALRTLLGFNDLQCLQRTYRQWVEGALAKGPQRRNGCWSESLAVGRRSFVVQFLTQSGKSGRYHPVTETDGSYSLRESATRYDGDFYEKTGPPSPKNGLISANSCLKTRG